MKDIMDTQNTAITGNFNMTAQMPNGRTVAVAGYIYDGESIQSLNERMDSLYASMERQRRKAELPELELKLEQLMKAAEQHNDAYEKLVDRQKSGDKLSSQEKMAMTNYPVSIKHIMEEVDKGRVEIDIARKASA